MDLLSKHENFESEGTITIFISERFIESIESQTVQPSPIYKPRVAVHTLCHMRTYTQQNVINISNGTKMCEGRQMCRKAVFKYSGIVLIFKDRG